MHPPVTGPWTHSAPRSIEISLFSGLPTFKRSHWRILPPRISCASTIYILFPSIPCTSTNCIAVYNPLTPPPTITTSYSYVSSSILTCCFFLTQYSYYYLILKFKNLQVYTLWYLHYSHLHIDINSAMTERYIVTFRKERENLNGILRAEWR